MSRPRFLSDRDALFCFDSLSKGLRMDFLAHYVYGVSSEKLRCALSYIRGTITAKEIALMKKHDIAKERRSTLSIVNAMLDECEAKNISVLQMLTDIVKVSLLSDDEDPMHVNGIEFVQKIDKDLTS